MPILKREVPVMAFSLIVAFLLMVNGYLGAIDGYIMLSILVVVIAIFTYVVMNADKKKIKLDIPIKYKYSHAWGYLLIGLSLLIISARMLTSSAVALAHYFGVGDIVIGLTIVAIGTSLPELAASIVGVKKGEDDIAIGNVIGSNILGMLAVLAMPAIFSPGVIDKIIIYRDFGFMALTTILFWISCYCFDGDKMLINRREGAAGVLLFIGYVLLLYYFPG